MISQRTLARLYIAEAVKNSSSSIRACWTIVFTAATIGALTPLTATLRCALNITDSQYIILVSGSFAGLSCQGFHTWKLWLTVWLFVLYFVTFIRFYLGGLRVFDIRYNEMFALVNFEIKLASEANQEEEQVMESGPSRRVAAALGRFEQLLSYNSHGQYSLEVFWLLIQSLIVVSLAYAINNPRLFLQTFAILLTANAIYLVIIRSIKKRAITNLEHEIFPEWKESEDPKIQKQLRAENLPNHATFWWSINNGFHALMIFIMMFLYTDFGIPAEFNVQLISALLICSSNSIADFILTWNFYFPKFEKKYEILQN